MNTYQQRLDRVRAAMQEQELGALILTPGAAMRYLTGFSEEGYERLLALVVPGDGQDALFVTPRLNAAQAAHNPAGITAIHAWDDAEGWQGVFSRAVRGLPLNAGTMGLDDEMPARFSLPLAGLLPNARFMPAGPVLAALRTTKDADELAAMQRAADATDALLPALYSACRPGVTELELALTIQTGLARSGWEASFSPIIGAGANGASPHHHTGQTKLQSGDVVILDLGAKCDSYCGDITRTVAVGHAPDEARRIYEIVYRAYQAGVQAVRPGATGQDVDAAARRVITDDGYGEFFVHRTGHGIGLDDHEPPYIVAGNDIPLRSGECFSIEPGVYLPGRFGVRLENIVTVQDDGTARVFNEAIPPELPVL